MAVTQETRAVSDFDEIHLQGTGELILTQGETEALVIEADDGLLPRLKSEVNTGRLELGLTHWYDFIALFPNPTIRYYITFRKLRGVILSGSGRLRAGPVQTDRLRLRVSGSGDLEIGELRAADLEVSFSGSGKARLSGEVQRQEVEISGSAEVLAEELASQAARVRISGSGSLRLRVEHNLDVHISGSGDVRYHGHPQIEQRITGSGRIQEI